MIFRLLPNNSKLKKKQVAEFQRIIINADIIVLKNDIEWIEVPSNNLCCVSLMTPTNVAKGQTPCLYVSVFKNRKENMKILALFENSTRCG